MRRALTSLLAVAAAVGVTPGCDSRGRRLDELEPAWVHVTAPFIRFHAGDGVRAEIALLLTGPFVTPNPDELQGRAGPTRPEDCGLSPRTEVWLNDEMMEVASLGGPWYMQEHHWYWCTSPLFFLRGRHHFRPPGSAQQDDVIRLTDGRTTRRIVVGDLLAERSLSLVSPASGVVRAGEEMVLAWSHPADYLEASLVQVAYETRPARGDTRLYLYEEERFEWDGHHLSFVLPAHAAPGPARLKVSVHRYVMLPTACEGFRHPLASEGACFVQGSMTHWSLDIETLPPVDE